jgi:hypothetical protein
MWHAHVAGARLGAGGNRFACGSIFALRPLTAEESVDA